MMLKPLPNQAPIIAGVTYDRRDFDLVPGGAIQLDADAKPVAGPIRRHWDNDTMKHYAMCDRCTGRSNLYVRKGSPNLLRWARKHRCFRET